MSSHTKTRVYLGVKTCDVFLCSVAIVRVRVYYVDLFGVYVKRGTHPEPAGTTRNLTGTLTGNQNNKIQIKVIKKQNKK